MLLPLESVCSILSLLNHPVDLETGEYGKPKMKRRQHNLWHSGQDNTLAERYIPFFIHDSFVIINSLDKDKFKKDV